MNIILCLFIYTLFLGMKIDKVKKLRTPAPSVALKGPTRLAPSAPPVQSCLVFFSKLIPALSSGRQSLGTAPKVSTQTRGSLASLHSIQPSPVDENPTPMTSDPQSPYLSCPTTLKDPYNHTTQTHNTKEARNLTTQPYNSVDLNNHRNFPVTTQQTPLTAYNFITTLQQDSTTLQHNHNSSLIPQPPKTGLSVSPQPLRSKHCPTSTKRPHNSPLHAILIPFVISTHLPGTPPPPLSPSILPFLSLAKQRRVGCLAYWTREPQAVSCLSDLPA